MQKPKFYTRYDHPATAARSSGKSLCHQEFKDDADINNIIARYMTTGVLGDPNATRQPIWGDFTQVPTLQESYNSVIAAREQFDALPIDVRRRFNFDPMQMLQFVMDEKNRDEAVRLGFIAAPPPTNNQPIVAKTKEPVDE